ncbi:hypothetical protein LY76DRAFT_651143 [Colletotrichum caudatum]|nr:hypothetical protein LY76DRAFT_651143 [Colletotrichum caudatum]
MASLTKEFQKHAPNQSLWDLWSNAPTGFITAAIRAMPNSRGRFHSDVAYAALRSLKAYFGVPAVVPAPRPPRPPAPAPALAPPPCPAAKSTAPDPGPGPDQAQAQARGQGKTREGEEEQEEEPELPRLGFMEDLDMDLFLGSPLDDTLTDLKLPLCPTPSPPPPCYDSDSCSEISVSGVITDYFARPGVPANPTTAKRLNRRPKTLKALRAKFREQLANDKRRDKRESKSRARKARAAKPRVRPTKRAKMARDLAKLIVDAFTEGVESEYARELSAQRVEAAKRSLRVLIAKKIKELL